MTTDVIHGYAITIVDGPNKCIRVERMGEYPTIVRCAHKRAAERAIKKYQRLAAESDAMRVWLCQIRSNGFPR